MGVSEFIVKTTPLVSPESKRLHAMDKKNKNFSLQIHLQVVISEASEISCIERVFARCTRVQG